MEESTQAPKNYQKLINIKEILQNQKELKKWAQIEKQNYLMHFTNKGSET